ncbi:MAG TPA: type IV secretion system DNA-binding domain-containing protein [Solirubrobacteraceae bacterium]|nr:type IV secretion system DNA-binding domain-containing protein [Solirubrobacteraceae bacterium]
MPSFIPAQPAAQPPPVQLLEAFQQLTTVAAECLLAVVVGLLGARLMRRHRLHWSWTVAPVAIAILGRGLLHHAAVPIGLGAVLAGWVVRRRQHLDGEDGVDGGDVLYGRTPRTLAAWMRFRVLGPRELVFRPSQPGTLLLGHDERWRRVTVPFGGGAGGTHTLVVGATGSGKTVTQSRIAVAAIAAGMGAVVIDPKGDAALREQLIAATRASGRRFLEWTPEGPCVYNPLARGSETEVADKALGSERFTEPHYLRQAQRYLGHEVRSLRLGGEQVTLAALVEYLDPSNLEQLLRELPAEDVKASFAYLDSLTPRQRGDLAGVRDRLAVLSESDAGVWLEPATGPAPEVDLLGCARERAVVLFTLRSDSRPLLSQMLAAAVVQDLQTVVAASQSDPVRTLVLIDEFSAVAPEHVVRLFGRARSAGISLVLGTQELADLRRAGGDSLAEQVIGNLGLLIAHRQVVPASAELICGVAGSRSAWRVSRHSGGASTRTRTRQPLLQPSEVMRLGTGWAAVLPLAHTQAPPVRITRILPVPDR